MSKKVFHSLALIGVIIICILAFTLPKNPYEIIPSFTIMSFDKPLWLNIIISCSFIYLTILYSIYDKIYN